MTLTAPVPLEVEPLLINKSNKYTIFPLVYPDIYQFFINHKKLIWFVNDIDFTKDQKDWAKLTADEQFFIKHVLAFFAASDGVVLENISTNFCAEIQVAEARAFYAMQMFSENEHSITYSTLIDTYITDKEEKLKLFNAIETMPSIMAKAVWAKRWIDSDAGLATRLLAFMCVEGIFFSGSFCSIYWLGERGILSGLTNSNAYIARDENLHCEFAAHLYNKYIINKLTQEEVTNMITEVVAIEKEFIVDALPCKLLGMNSDMMSRYIEFVANSLIVQLGYTTIWAGVQNPFPFMDKISLQNQTSFFDSRPTEYQKGVEHIQDFNKMDFDADF